MSNKLNNLHEIERIIAFHVSGSGNEYPTNNPLLKTIGEVIKDESKENPRSV